MNKKGVSAASLLLTAMMVATVTGCGSVKSASNSPNSHSTVVIALPPQVSPNWFFPVISSADYGDANFEMNVMMYVPLVHISRTDGINYQRSLASSITANKTGTVYTVHLNPKYHWSNGKPVTARDVVFTWNILKATSTGASNLPWGYGGAGSGGIPARWANVVAQGSHTVVVTLNTPSNPEWFIHNGLGQIVPVPASVWDKHPHNMVQELQFIKSVADSPSASPYKIVDGPYHFSQMAANNFWSFVPNPRYAGHRSQIQKVIFQYETSPGAEFLGLKTGTIDVGYLPASMWKNHAQLTKDVMTTPYYFGFTYLEPDYNTKAPGGLGPTFRHLYVRQAMEMGINQPAIIQSLFHGYGVNETNPIPQKPQTIFYDPKLANPLYPYNPAAGKRLLEQHGWHLTNGVMTKNGVSLKFTLLYISGSNTVANLVQLIKNDWAQEGIQVTLQPGPFDQVLSTAQQTDPTKWAMAFWGTSSWTYEPDYYPTGGSFYLTGAGANQGGYSNPQMNTLIKNSYAPGSPSQTLKALDAYQAYAAQQLPVIWLPYTPVFDEHAINVHGTVKTFNPITTFVYPNLWTISP